MNFDETDIVSALLDFNIVDSEEDAIDLCADIQGAVFANNKDEVAEGIYDYLTTVYGESVTENTCDQMAERILEELYQ